MEHTTLAAILVAALLLFSFGCTAAPVGEPTPPPDIPPPPPDNGSAPSPPSPPGGEAPPPAPV